MYRFQEKSKPLDLPDLGLRLVDVSAFGPDEKAAVKLEFQKDFSDKFLKVNFPDEKLCVTNDHLEKLFTAYCDESDALRESGKPAPELEDWSRIHAHKYIKNFNTAPHEGVMWFEIQSTRTNRRVGVLQISQINRTGGTDDKMLLSGHAIMTLPNHRVHSYGQYWGKLLRELLDKEFINVEDDTKTWAFEEWIFPTDRRSRYVSRPGLSFGADVIDAAKEGMSVDREGSSKEFAPKTLRSAPRGTR